MKNTDLTLQRSCAESWGIPLNNAHQTLIEAKGVFSDRAAPKTTQNTSKNKALLLFAFAADLTFRFDSDEVLFGNRYSTSTGEQAYV